MLGERVSKNCRTSRTSWLTGLHSRIQRGAALCARTIAWNRDQAVLPHPGPLPPGKAEPTGRRGKLKTPMGWKRCSGKRPCRALLPLPAGEGWGEGETHARDHRSIQPNRASEEFDLFTTSFEIQGLYRRPGRPLDFTRRVRAVLTTNFFLHDRARLRRAVESRPPRSHGSTESRPTSFWLRLRRAE